MQIYHRKAKLSDLDLYFEWTNDPATRSNSFNTQEVDYQGHTNWFTRKIEDKKALLLVFENEENIPVGQIRIEQKTDENIIGISIDKNFRGLGLAVPMLTSACEVFFTEFQAKNIHAYIKKTNLASLNSFKKAGFEIINELVISNETSYLLEKKYV
ncbi:GNAT family N-acetyltransferase [Emticicia sp. W12TSBA100-4]|uniref:GNAT family N-acetyltransferase n=1 Tax=Emticicia sp. W12TSBA100-4 TaxID=3160965 RepID=UPI00330628DA